MRRRLLFPGIVIWLLSMSKLALSRVKEEDINELHPTCTNWNSDPNFCNEQCTNMAMIANQRICRAKSLSKLYTELKHCEHKHSGICKWFRCKCFNPSEPDAMISLGHCKRRLAKYYKLNHNMGILGFEDY